MRAAGGAAGGSRLTRDAVAPLAAALDGVPTPPGSPREAAAQIEAADRVVQRRAPDADLLVSAAGHTQQLAYRAVADRPGWDRRLDGLLPRRAAPRDPGQRRRPPSVPVDAPDAVDRAGLRAARLADRRPAAGARAAGATTARPSGVPASTGSTSPPSTWWRPASAGSRAPRSPGRRDRCSSSRRRGTSTGAGGDIRDTRDAILAAGRLLEANGFRARPDLLVVQLQQLRCVRARGVAVRPGDAATSRDLPRLPPVAGLLPDAGGQRVAADRVRRAPAGAGQGVPGADQVRSCPASRASRAGWPSSRAHCSARSPTARAAATLVALSSTNRTSSAGAPSRARTVSK